MSISYILCNVVVNMLRFANEISENEKRAEFGYKKTEFYFQTLQNRSKQYTLAGQVLLDFLAKFSFDIILLR